MKIKNRHLLRNREASKINEELKKKLGTDVFGDSEIERGEIENREVLLIDGKPLLSKFEGEIFPNVLGFLEINPKKRHIVVDQGAVPHVVNGADIMAPGVVGLDEGLSKNELAFVTEEAHDKPIAVVKMMVDGGKVKGMEEGKIAKNLHHIRDDLWDEVNRNY